MTDSARSSLQQTFDSVGVVYPHLDLYYNSHPGWFQTAVVTNPICFGPKACDLDKYLVYSKLFGNLNQALTKLFQATTNSVLRSLNQTFDSASVV